MNNKLARFSVTGKWNYNHNKHTGLAESCQQCSDRWGAKPRGLQAAGIAAADPHKALDLRYARYNQGFRSCGKGRKSIRNGTCATAEPVFIAQACAVGRSAAWKKTVQHKLRFKATEPRWRNAHLALTARHNTCEGGPIVSGRGIPCREAVVSPIPWA